MFPGKHAYFDVLQHQYKYDFLHVILKLWLYGILQRNITNMKITWFMAMYQFNVVLIFHIIQIVIE